ncbi:MAG TPA: glucokinase [Alphaproteobacteria bacterium]|nr:glucokinase [Alphaproteobacteria bacterium]
MPRTALIADIGGTNARFGIVDAQGTHDLKYLECKNYAGPAEAAEDYLKQVSCKARPASCIMSIAGPVDGDLVDFTNLDWTFRLSKTKEELKLDYFEAMNDFKAVALAIPDIDPTLLHKIGGGEKREEEPMGVIGPGTGLGVAYLTWNGKDYDAHPTEGGHVTMPATTEREFSIFHRMLAKYHHISAERVCSGKGLENLYSAIKVLDHKFDLPDLDAPEISKKAMDGSCVVCKEALDLMLAFLGRVSGNLVLSLGARGGIYIAGGIPTKLGDYFLKSRFWEEYRAKGRMTELVEQIPVYLIKHDAIGLLGLEQTAKRHL